MVFADDKDQKKLLSTKLQEKLTHLTNYQHCARNALRAYMSGDIPIFLNSTHFMCHVT